MTGRLFRILLVAFVLLLPVTAWLVLGHVQERRRLLDESMARVRHGADNLETGLVARVASIGSDVDAVLAAGPSSVADLRSALRGRLPRGSELTPATGDPERAELRSDPERDLVLVVDARLPDGEGIRARVPLDLVPPSTDRPRSLLVTDLEGDVLWRHPEEEKRSQGEQDRRKTSTRATRAVAGRESGDRESYRDLDDKKVVGAWRTVEGIGGVLAEERHADALGPVRGARPWHFAAGLLVLTGIPLLLMVIGTRWSAGRALVRLYAYARPYWKLILLIVVAMGLYAAGTGAQLYMIKVLVEDVLLNRASDEAWRTLLLLSGAMIVVVLIMAAGRFAKQYFSVLVTQSVVNDVRCDVGRHLMTLSLGFFHRRRQGDLISRLTNDVSQTRKALRLIFGDIVEQPLLLVAAVAAGFATNWRLALMIFLAFPLLAYPIARFGRKIKRYAKKRQVQRADVTNVMMQMISGVRIVKAFRAEDREAARLRKASDTLLRRSKKVARTTALSETVLELFNHIGAVAVLLAGGYFVLYGQMGITVADLVTFSAILGRMYKPVKDITKTYNKIQDSRPSIERVFEILDSRAGIVDGPEAVPLGKPGETIRFEGVSFAYEDDPVLTDVSFEAPVGSIVALVGPTGAGKSTLTDLVARFYDPQAGRLLIDGTDLRGYTLESLLSRVAVVTQDPFLFHTTIRDNILYGRPDATPDEVEAAAKAAFVHEEILAQPKGYDTVVGERGGRLSGGQRQRVTIARAILKDADILILDEATSSLDSRSEGEVQKALANLMEGRTTFVVAHRLSTIRNADRILVLDRGRIIESGTHDELIEKGGLYGTLHAMQEAGGG